jgi:hypothetical protein
MILASRDQDRSVSGSILSVACPIEVFDGAPAVADGSDELIERSAELTPSTWMELIRDHVCSAQRVA